MIDVFEIKLHYPMPIFIYKSNIKSSYEFYKFLNKLKEETIIIINENDEFISFDELEISKNYKLKNVLVPKGNLLAKIFLGFINNLNIYKFFVPIPKSNPFGKKLLNKENRDERWHNEWKNFLKYISLIKDKIIKFDIFEDEYISLIVSKIIYKEPEFKINELVKLKNKSIYGRIIQVREKSVFLDNGEFYNKTDLVKVEFEPYIDLKPSENQFLINFFVKNLNKEIIKYGFELKRKHFEFEKIIEDDINLEELLKDKRVNLIFKNEKIREKYKNFKFPFIIDNNSEISFEIENPSFLKNPKKLYIEILKKFIKLNFNCPRVYSKEPLKLKLKSRDYLIAKNYKSVICKEDEINIILKLLS